MKSNRKKRRENRAKRKIKNGFKNQKWNFLFAQIDLESEYKYANSWQKRFFRKAADSIPELIKLKEFCKKMIDAWKKNNTWRPIKEY